MSTIKRYLQHLGSVTKRIVAKRRKGESTVNSTTKDFLVNNRKNWKTMWTEQDILLAEELHERGLSTAEIAIALCRSDGSILTMLSKRRNEYPAVMRRRPTTPEAHQGPSAEDVAHVVAASATWEEAKDRLKQLGWYVDRAVDVGTSEADAHIARMDAALRKARDRGKFYSKRQVTSLVTAIFDKVAANTAEIARLEAALKAAQDKLAKGAWKEQPHNIARQQLRAVEPSEAELARMNAALYETWKAQLKAHGKSLD